MRSFIASLFFIINLAMPACAQVLSGLGQDPFFLNEAGIRDFGNRNVNNKTLALQTINSGIRNLVLIMAGQSNAQATITTTYTPTNPSALDNFNIYDGAIYKAVEPLNGSGANGLGDGWIGYNPALLLADALVTAGKFDRVIIVPISLGGSTVADWTTGVLGNRFTVAGLRLAQRGIVPGTNVTFVTLWGQGEGDNLAGTSQAAYVAGFNTMVAKAQAAGITGKWFVPKQSYAAGAFSSAIQAAQTAASPSGVINNAAGIYAGANADALVGSVCVGSAACRQADNTHFTIAGQQSYTTDATYGWQQALHASGAPF